MKKNKNKGIVYTIIGLLFVILGMTSKTFQSSNILTYSLLILGIILTALGFIRTMSESKKNTSE